MMLSSTTTPSGSWDPELNLQILDHLLAAGGEVNEDYRILLRGWLAGP